eukprot:TRINITY_DN11708_c0_g1_i1.p1 TRINITY_DN11708_c0_g1~~TRINITY_DN11708_c0_g1_i1.p1  ORF type:complete len:361 (-),score=52.18 TRINITY_DN11708_c0_g1_i1:206-1288(-)
MHTIKKRISSPGKYNDRVVHPIRKERIKLEYSLPESLFFGLILIPTFLSVLYTDDDVTWWNLLNDNLYNGGVFVPGGSPASYLYAPALYLARILSTMLHKVYVYYCVRLAFGVITCAALTFYYSSLRIRFSGRIAFVFSTFLLFSTGLFSTITSFTPLNLWMWILLVVQGLWFRSPVNYTLLSISLTFAVGFDMYMILFVFPIGCHIIYKKGYLFFGMITAASTVSFLLFKALIETSITLWGFDNGSVNTTFPESSLLGFVEDLHIVFSMAVFVIPVCVYSPSIIRRTLLDDDYSITLYHIGTFLLFGFSLFSREHSYYFQVLQPIICLCSAIVFTAAFDGMLEVLNQRRPRVFCDISLI